MAKYPQVVLIEAARISRDEVRVNLGTLITSIQELGRDEDHETLAESYEIVGAGDYERMLRDDGWQVVEIANHTEDGEHVVVNTKTKQAFDVRNRQITELDDLAIALVEIQQEDFCFDASDPEQVLQMWANLGDALGMMRPSDRETIIHRAVSGWLAYYLGLFGERVGEVGGVEIWEDTVGGEPAENEVIKKIAARYLWESNRIDELPPVTKVDGASDELKWLTEEAE